jgi:hypothetical protein
VGDSNIHAHCPKQHAAAMATGTAGMAKKPTDASESTHCHTNQCPYTGRHDCVIHGHKDMFVMPASTTRNNVVLYNPTHAFKPLLPHTKTRITTHPDSAV